MISLRALWRDAGYWRLAFALALSLLLHVILVGEFYPDLPDLNEKRQVIEARLVLPKPVIKQVALPKPVPPKPKPVKLKEIPITETPVKEAPVEEAPLPEIPEITEFLPVTEPLPEPLPQVSAFASDVEESITQPEQVIPSDAENQAETTDIIVNKDVYQYVETEFDLYTDKETVLVSKPAGKASMVYQVLPSGEEYQIKSLIQANGLAALFMPDLLQISDGNIGHNGLEPSHYLYQFGDKKNKTFSANFDWQTKALNLHSAKGDDKLELTEGTQDLLSFMYQFMFVAPLQNMQLRITNGKKLGVYHYRFVGEETIETKLGKIKTFHLVRAAVEGEKKTELWLALDYHYVPVKIRETDKKGRVYDLLVTSLKTEKPVTLSQ
ncbi:MAG: DUF3108 domain-containing protein [Methylotenera sp.]|nr:DUF3108 domain-containing protein [Methylotenera sp.]